MESVPRLLLSAHSARRADAAQLRPQPRGAYVGSRPGDMRLAMAFLVVFDLVLVVAGIATLAGVVSPGEPVSYQATPASGQLSRLDATLLGIGLLIAGIGIPILVWQRSRAGSHTPVSRVSWDEHGVEVTRYSGEHSMLRWEELRGLRALYSRLATGWFVAVTGGRSFDIWSGGPSGSHAGYGELVDALKAHIWTRNEDGDDEEAGGAVGAGPARGEAMTPSQQPECRWCGETFPVGTTKCALCGRPLSTET